MQDTKRSVAPAFSSGDRSSNEVYRIFIPKDQDRSKYIEHCRRTNTVSIVSDYGDVMHGVPVTRLAAGLIEFPEQRADFGSLVLCSYIPSLNRMVVTDVLYLSTESDYLQEQEYAIQKGEEQVSVKGKSKRVDIHSSDRVQITSQNAISLHGRGNVSVQAEELSHGAENSISEQIESPTEDENILLIEKDRVSVNWKLLEGEAEKLLFALDAEKGLTYEDEKTNTLRIDKTEGVATLKPKNKIKLGNGNEPILLGQTTVSLLRELLTTLQTTQAGPYFFSSQAQLGQIAGKLESLLSGYSFTD